MTPQREEANQQAAEKALKAVMCLHGLEFRRTHDLEALAGHSETLMLHRR